MSEPTTEAGKWLLDDFDQYAMHDPTFEGSPRMMPVDEETLRMWIDAIEAEAAARALAEVRERVEGLIVAAGGRCVMPADYSDDSINICETHSEIIFGDTGTCEDDPRQLRAGLAGAETLVVAGHFVAKTFARAALSIPVIEAAGVHLGSPEGAGEGLLDAQGEALLAACAARGITSPFDLEIALGSPDQREPAEPETELRPRPVSRGGH